MTTDESIAILERLRYRIMTAPQQELDEWIRKSFGIKPPSRRLVRVLQSLGKRKKPAMALARQAKRALRIQWRNALDESSRK